MLEFIDTIISEPLKDLYNGLKNETSLWKKLRYDIKQYIQDLGAELDEFTVHRANKLIKLSNVFVEPKLLDKILSECYFFDFPPGTKDDPTTPEMLQYILKRNPKALIRKHIIEKENYKNIYELLLQYDKLIILGQPGSGKTTILRKLVIDIAASAGFNRIPVYIPLRNSGLRIISVFKFIQKQFEDYRIEKPELLTKRLLERGSLLVLFDGIDEIANNEKQRILEELNAITIEYPLNKFVTTSRLSSYKGELLKFKEVEICEFTISDTELYINHWFQNDDNKIGLIEKINKYPQIAEVANNPLLLSLICIVYEFDLEISSRRSTLYKRCIECLMRDWDAQRNFRRKSKFSKLDDLKRISILSHLGYNLHKAGKIYFDLQTIETYLSEVIQKYGLYKEEIPSVIEEIVDSYGLIIKVSKNMYSFSHLTFQEYFSATYISEKRLFLQNDFEFPLNPYWEEVLILCASILPDATEYLTKLLESECPNSENVILAGLCLSVDPVVDLELKIKILQSLLYLYHNYKRKDVFERALYSLVRIDDTFLGKQLLKGMGVDKYYIQLQTTRKK